MSYTHHTRLRGLKRLCRFYYRPARSEYATHTTPRLRGLKLPQLSEQHCREFATHTTPRLRGLKRLPLATSSMIAAKLHTPHPDSGD